MEVFNLVLPWEPRLLMPINDIQYDGPDGAADLQKLAKHLDWGMERNALFVGLGDFTDFASTSERHTLVAGKLHETTGKRLERAAMEDIKDLYKILEPTKGNWLGCVPLDTEILTRVGWRTYDQLQIGEEVLGYNPETDQGEWTTLRGIVQYQNQPTVQLESKSFKVTCTPDHMWFGKRQEHADGNADGPKIAKPFHSRTDQLTASHRIKVAAAEAGTTSTVTCEEAFLLGLLVTDGTFYFPTNPSQSQAFLYQSRPEVVEQIRTRLGSVLIEREDTRASTDIVEPNGVRTITRARPNIRFYVKKSILWPLYEKTRFTGKADLPRIVANLAYDTRQAMLEGMLLGDGNGEDKFNQNEGPVLDAFCILAALQGYRTGCHTVQGKCHTVSLMKRGLAGVADMEVTVGPVVDVWCPQTALQSWVMRQGEQITVTGNCLQGHHFFEFSDGHTSDTLLAEWLDAPFLGDSALGFIRFKNKSNHMASVKIFLHHGAGGAGVMPAAAINKLYHMKVGYPAVQLFLQAHVPQLGAVKIDSLDITDVTEPVIFDTSTRFVACGGWSRSMQQCSSYKGRKQGSYAEKAMMRPGVMGGAVIGLTPEREQRGGTSIYQVDIKVTI